MVSLQFRCGVLDAVRDSHSRRRRGADSLRTQTSSDEVSTTANVLHTHATTDVPAVVNDVTSSSAASFTARQPDDDEQSVAGGDRSLHDDRRRNPLKDVGAFSVLMVLIVILYSYAKFNTSNCGIKDKQQNNTKRKKTPCKK